MSDIVYTREVWSDAIGDSDLVDEVYYNENTGDLYVDLDGPVYKYTNVPADVVDAFENAGSAGAFYNTEIKRKFGPGDNLGQWSSLDYKDVPVEDKVDVNVATGTMSIPSPLGVINVALDPSDVVTVPGNPPKTFSLKPFSDETAKVEGVEREYVVTFEVSGLTEFKRHTLRSTSVDEAVQSVLDLGKMLELSFIVREVTIRFE